MKRAGDELGFTKDRMVELRQLKPGEFFAFGPAISDEVIKLKVGDVKTTHAKVGYSGSAKVPPPSAVIKKILAEIKDLPAEAEQEAKTVAELKKENAELKRRMVDPKRHDFAHFNPALPKIDYESRIKQAVDKAVHDVEKRMQGRIEHEQKYYSRQIKTLLDTFSKIHKLTDPESFDIKPRLDEIFSPEALEPAESLKMFGSIPIIEDPNMKPHEWKIERHGLNPIKNPGHVMGSDMNKGEREILTAIAQHDGATTEHIAVLTGYKNTSRREYLRKLASRGYITKNGDVYQATQEGILSLGNFTPLPTGPALVQHYLDTLPEGEKRLFDAILLQHPSPVDAAILQNETGYKATSTREYLRKLIARKIVFKEGNLYKFNENLYGTN